MMNHDELNIVKCEERGADVYHHASQIYSKNWCQKEHVTHVVMLLDKNYDISCGARANPSHDLHLDTQRYRNLVMSTWGTALVTVLYSPRVSFQHVHVARQHVTVHVAALQNSSIL